MKLFLLQILAVLSLASDLTDFEAGNSEGLPSHIWIYEQKCSQDIQCPHGYVCRLHPKLRYKICSMDIHFFMKDLQSIPGYYQNDDGAQYIVCYSQRTRTASEAS